MTIPPRSCGPCTACCTVLGVPELSKAIGEPCGHLCDAGCGIYADRPGSCRTFECQWLRGLLEVDGGVDPGLRPDVCGVVFDFQPGTPSGDIYTAWEVVPGASAVDPARGVIRALGGTAPVVVMPTAAGDGRGPLP